MKKIFLKDQRIRLPVFWTNKCVWFFTLRTQILSELKDANTTTQNKGNQEIFQRLQMTFLISCHSNFPHYCSLNELRKAHFKIYTETNLKRFEIHSLTQIIYEKIYVVLSNFKNIILGMKLEKKKTQNKYELKGILTIV